MVVIHYIWKCWGFQFFPFFVEIMKKEQNIICQKDVKDEMKRNNETNLFYFLYEMVKEDEPPHFVQMSSIISFWKIFFKDI